MAQDKDNPMASLCRICAGIELQFFSDFEKWQKESTSRPRLDIPTHESLGDLIASASDGCNLCEMFLHGYLSAQVDADNGLYSDTVAAKDYLLADERCALKSTDAAHDKRPYCFYLSMVPDDHFWTPTPRSESIGATSTMGFVTMTLCRYWQHSDRGEQTPVFAITSDLGSAACIEGHFYGRAVTPRPDFDFPKALLQECQLSHSCLVLPSMNPAHQPTRLIHIHGAASGEGLILNLCELREPHPYPYVALSHRWSIEMDCKTLRHNLHDRMNRIDLDMLPQTFQDAVHATSALGLVYIWIDCLCIVQDDKSDWEAECPKMGHIYANAVLTIAASQASDSSAGFLHTRGDTLPLGSCRVRYWNRYDQPEGGLVISYVAFGNERGPYLPGIGNILDQRGWTLQESLLSARILSFEQHKMYWQCNVKRRLESLHYIHTNRWVYRIIKQDLELLEPTAIYKWWYGVLENYCERKLSYQMDRLPAISGIAVLVRRYIQDSYLAGIWQGDLARGLAWISNLNSEFADDRLQRVQIPYRAPSWSWARSDCGTAVPCFPNADSFAGAFHGHVQLVRANIKLRGSDDCGQVEPGSTLRVRAPVKQGIMGRGRETSPERFAHKAKVIIRLPYNTTDRNALRVSIDDLAFLSQILTESLSTRDEWSEEHKGLEVTIMQLGTCELPKQDMLESYGLVLMPTTDGNGLRRVGLLNSAFPELTKGRATTAIDDWFADAEMQDITLA